MSKCTNIRIRFYSLVRYVGLSTDQDLGKHILQAGGRREMKINFVVLKSPQWLTIR